MDKPTSQTMVDKAAGFEQHLALAFRDQDLPKRVFVTGGSGYVGGRVIRALCTLGVQVTGLARSQRSCDKVAQCGATPALGALHDEDVLIECMKPAEAVIHCAARKNGRLWSAYLQDNVQATSRMLGLAAKLGVRQFVNLSTASVIAGCPKPAVGIDEQVELPLARWSPYLFSKLTAEREVAAANGRGGMATCSLRPCLIWGEDAPFHRNVERLSKGPLGFVSCAGGDFPYATIHVNNLVEAILAVLATPSFARPDRPLAGGAWFVNDSYAPTTPSGPHLGAFIARLQAALGVPTRMASVPYGMMRSLAWLGDGAFSALMRGQTLNLQTGVRLFGQSLSTRDAAFRRMTSYQGLMSMDQGMLTVR